MPDSDANEAPHDRSKGGQDEIREAGEDVASRQHPVEDQPRPFDEGSSYQDEIVDGTPQDEGPERQEETPTDHLE